jgi:undecaprenyl-diphosphatase
MPQIVAWNAIVFGTLLYLCDRYGHSIRRMSDMTLSPALIIGVAQAIAIIPGTSRSGITMTAGRALGFERPEAARFAFLLGIPAIAGAGVLKLGDAVSSGESISLDVMLTAVLTFFVALGTITILMKLVRHVSFLPFAIYRILLGVVLLGLIITLPITLAMGQGMGTSRRLRPIVSRVNSRICLKVKTSGPPSS